MKAKESGKQSGEKPIPDILKGRNCKRFPFKHTLSSLTLGVVSLVALYIIFEYRYYVDASMRCHSSHEIATFVIHYLLPFFCILNFWFVYVSEASGS